VCPYEHKPPINFMFIAVTRSHATNVAPHIKFVSEAAGDESYEVFVTPMRG